MWCGEHTSAVRFNKEKANARSRYLQTNKQRKRKINTEIGK